jgi:A/G-specific adenine glycosylase
MPRVPEPPSPVGAALTGPVLSWYAGAARDLPWRRPGTTPWGVLVSEVMAQQTPLARVEPAYAAWLERWPTPAALARSSPGEAVRQWGRLGYPRRALRLHETASAIVERHGGEVPSSLADLLALPGIGEYTARAIASFAFGQRHPIVDTNVRRLLARVLDSTADAPGPGATARDRARVEALLPPEPATAARFGVAFMELGALVCTARAPRCPSCPLSQSCAWLAAGRPHGAPRPGQPYAGTDRQVRGRLLAVLRDAEEPVPPAVLASVWDEPVQRDRALAALVEDGLAVATAGGYALPR